MNLLETGDILDARGVPPEMYSLGQDANEAYCVVRDPDGWSVYYSERGNRTDPRMHASEDRACLDLIARVLSEIERDLTW